ncbi:MAG: AAA family ATPase [Acutalibacteraceae bacterium]|nr:AAA family ATPase [Acutalibacteraceae bacterium]
MLKEELLAYIKKCGSQSAAAKNIGYSPAVVNQYLKGSYSGDVAKFEEKLKEIFANLEAEKEVTNTLASGGYVPTSISQSVYNTIRLCHLKGGIAIECGDAGIGKTMACKKYKEDYPNTAIYIMVNPCISSVTALLKYICLQLGLQTGRKDDMWLRIANRLSGERKVLIIDEAQHLPIKTIETIRSFFDAYPEIGVCMVGNEDTYTNLHSGRAAFAQIISRTKLKTIRHTSEIVSHDIELLYPAFTGKKKEIELMLKIARSEQGIRGTQNLYSNAVDNQDISYAGLVAMAKAMKINLKVA